MVIIDYTRYAFERAFSTLCYLYIYVAGSADLAHGKDIVYTSTI